MIGEYEADQADSYSHVQRPQDSSEHVLTEVCGRVRWQYGTARSSLYYHPTITPSIVDLLPNFVKRYFTNIVRDTAGGQ